MNPPTLPYGFTSTFSSLFTESGNAADEIYTTLSVFAYVLAFVGLLLMAYRVQMTGETQGMWETLGWTAVVAVALQFLPFWVRDAQNVMGFAMLDSMDIDIGQIATDHAVEVGIYITTELAVITADIVVQATVLTTLAATVVAASVALGLAIGAAILDVMAILLLAWLAIAAAWVWLAVLLAYVVQTLSLQFGVAAAPIFLGMFLFEQTKTTALRYFIGLTGMLFWPLGWGIGFKVVELVKDKWHDVMLACSPLVALDMVFLGIVDATVYLIITMMYWTMIKKTPPMIMQALTSGSQIGAGIVAAGVSSAMGTIGNAISAAGSVASSAMSMIGSAASAAGGAAMGGLGGAGAGIRPPGGGGGMPGIGSVGGKGGVSVTKLGGGSGKKGGMPAIGGGDGPELLDKDGGGLLDDVLGDKEGKGPLDDLAEDMFEDEDGDPLSGKKKGKGDGLLPKDEEPHLDELIEPDLQSFFDSDLDAQPEPPAFKVPQKPLPRPPGKGQQEVDSGEGAEQEGQPLMKSGADSPPSNVAIDISEEEFEEAMELNAQRFEQQRIERRKQLEDRVQVRAMQKAGFDVPDELLNSPQSLVFPQDEQLIEQASDQLIEMMRAELESGEPGLPQPPQQAVPGTPSHLANVQPFSQPQGGYGQPVAPPNQGAQPQQASGFPPNMPPQADYASLMQQEVSSAPAGQPPMIPGNQKVDAQFKAMPGPAQGSNSPQQGGTPPAQGPQMQAPEPTLEEQSQVMMQYYKQLYGENFEALHAADVHRTGPQPVPQAQPVQAPPNVQSGGAQPMRQAPPAPHQAEANPGGFPAQVQNYVAPAPNAPNAPQPQVMQPAEGSGKPPIPPRPAAFPQGGTQPRREGPPPPIPPKPAVETTGRARSGAFSEVRQSDVPKHGTGETTYSPLTDTSEGKHEDSAFLKMLEKAAEHQGKLQVFGASMESLGTLTKGASKAVGKAVEESGEDIEKWGA